MPSGIRSSDAAAELNNGLRMPYLGLGVFKAGEATRQVVRWALEMGYRHIDTASAYENEADVGKAIRDSGLRRESIFVTTKIWNDEQGHEPALRAMDQSLQRLGMEYVDLYLIHWPAPQRLHTWDALVELREAGKARAIGVSNFAIRHLEELAAHSSVVPAVNQVEFHPFLFDRELLEYCRRHGIQLEAYSPLTRGRKLDDSRLGAIAARYHKTPAQILIRWCIEHRVVVIPKSSHRERLHENGDVFDFEIADEDLLALDELNEGFRTTAPGWEPENWP